MNWEAFFDLLKQYPKLTVAGVVAVFVAGTSAGSWLLHAEQCHAQAQNNEAVIEKLLKYQERQIERERVKAEQEKLRKEYIYSLCAAGKLKDRDECAKVGYAIATD